MERHRIPQSAGADIDAAEQEARPEGIEKLAQVPVEKAEGHGGEKHRRGAVDGAHPVQQEPPENELLHDGRQEHGKQGYGPEIHPIQDLLQRIGPCAAQQPPQQAGDPLAQQIAGVQDAHAHEQADEQLSRPAQARLFRQPGRGLGQEQEEKGKAHQIQADEAEAGDEPSPEQKPRRQHPQHQDGKILSRHRRRQKNEAGQSDAGIMPSQDRGHGCSQGLLLLS